MSGLVFWQVVLLVPHPILTLLYLLAVRVDYVNPGFTPVVAFAGFPVASAILGLPALRQPEPVTTRGRQMMLFGLAALEIAFSVLAAAFVGFAIGLKSL